MLNGLHLRVDNNKIRTLHEEHDYLEEQMWQTGSFFACDVHPNKVKTSIITGLRLYRKLRDIEQQEDYISECK